MLSPLVASARIFVVSSVVLVAGHASMPFPPTRQTHGKNITCGNEGCNAGCFESACLWYQVGCMVGCLATNCDRLATSCDGREGEGAHGGGMAAEGGLDAQSVPPRARQPAARTP